MTSTSATNVAVESRQSNVPLLDWTFFGATRLATALVELGRRDASAAASRDVAAHTAGHR